MPVSFACSTGLLVQARRSGSDVSGGGCILEAPRSPLHSLTAIPFTPGDTIYMCPPLDFNGDAYAASKTWPESFVAIKALRLLLSPAAAAGVHRERDERGC